MRRTTGLEKLLIGATTFLSGLAIGYLDLLPSFNQEEKTEHVTSTSTGTGPIAGQPLPEGLRGTNPIYHDVKNVPYTDEVKARLEEVREMMKDEISIHDWTDGKGNLDAFAIYPKVWSAGVPFKLLDYVATGIKPKQK